jgi:hypothetical protein
MSFQARLAEKKACPLAGVDAIMLSTKGTDPLGAHKNATLTVVALRGEAELKQSHTWLLPVAKLKYPCPKVDRLVREVINEAMIISFFML